MSRAQRNAARRVTSWLWYHRQRGREYTIEDYANRRKWGTGTRTAVPETPREMAERILREKGLLPRGCGNA